MSWWTPNETNITLINKAMHMEAWWMAVGTNNFMPLLPLFIIQCSITSQQFPTTSIKWPATT